MTAKPNSYEGFNEYNPLLDTDVSSALWERVRSFLSYLKSLKYDTDLQQAVLKTSHGRRAQAVITLLIYPIANRSSVSFRLVQLLRRR